MKPFELRVVWWSLKHGKASSLNPLLAGACVWRQRSGCSVCPGGRESQAQVLKCGQFHVREIHSTSWLQTDRQIISFMWLHLWTLISRGLSMDLINVIVACCAFWRIIHNHMHVPKAGVMPPNIPTLSRRFSASKRGATYAEERILSLRRRHVQNCLSKMAYMEIFPQKGKNFVGKFPTKLQVSISLVQNFA